MPQMSPMPWVMILITTTILILTLMNTLPQTNILKKSYKKNTKKEKTMKW